MGRPASAATATVNIEPETKPPGKPTRSIHPAERRSAASPQLARVCCVGEGRGASRTSGPSDRMTTALRWPLSPTINAAQSRRRQTPRRVEVTGSDVNLRRQFAECRRRLAPAAPVDPSTPPWLAGRAARSVDILGRSRIRKNDAAAPGTRSYAARLGSSSPSRSAISAFCS